MGVWVGGCELEKSDLMDCSAQFSILFLNDDNTTKNQNFNT